jgi:hypothetical protein
MPAKYPRAAEWKGADVVGPGLVLIVTIAVAVGVLVFRLTAGGETRTVSEEPGLEEGPASDPTSPTARGAPSGALEAFTPGGSSATSWSDRLGGAMGLVIAVAIGAIVLAFSLWTLVSFVGRLISGLDADAGGPSA